MAPLDRMQFACHRFACDEDASVSTVGLFSTLCLLAVGGLALDASNAYLVRNRLQITADAAALAAAAHLPDTTSAQIIALEYVEKNLPVSQFGAASSYATVHFGEWNAVTGILDTTAATPDTISVELSKRSGQGGRIAPLLLGIIGFEGFETGAVSLSMKTAGALPPSVPGGGLNCAVFAFAGGTSIINSSTSLTGDVCYASGVSSTTNQKAETFVGTTRVHTGVTAFGYNDDNFLPTGGVLTLGQDYNLDQEDARLKNLSATLGSLAPNATLADPLILAGGTVVTVPADPSGVTVIQLSELDINGATLRLDGPGSYVFNFTQDIFARGTFNFSHGEIELVNGAATENVFWNFLDPFDIMVNKSTNVFRGAIIGPDSSVVYHNPADFDGSIAALDINLHSMFDLYGFPATFSGTGEAGPGGGRLVY